MNAPQLDGPLHHLQRLVAIAEGADAHLKLYRGCEIERDTMATFFGLVLDEARAAMAALQGSGDGADDPLPPAAPAPAVDDVSQASAQVEPSPIEAAQ